MIFISCAWKKQLFHLLLWCINKKEYGRNKKVLKKAQTFRVNYPDYVNHQIYLGLASMAFYPELEQECIRKGIAIVKQVGDTVIINDEHLKIF